MLKVLRLLSQLMMRNLLQKQLEAKGEVIYPNTGVELANIADIDDTTRQSINLPDDVNNGVLIGNVKR